jgi:hypothetical protein
MADNPARDAESVPLAALREFIAGEAHSCPTCPPGSEDDFYIDVHSLDLFLRQFDGTQT